MKRRHVQRKAARIARKRRSKDYGKHLALAAVLIAVVLSIWFLQGQRAGPGVIDPGAERELPERAFPDHVHEPSGDAVAPSFFPRFEYSVDDSIIKNKLSRYPKTPELAGISGYLNSPEFSLRDLRGQVVLIDFWTYSCINCIRTQPYLNAWHEAYSDDGLVIVGVHTPEFEFEKDPENVRKAMEDAGIAYPVVQDNRYETWNAFRNRFWPRKYLIDVDGFIRYDRIGEGAYEQTEDAIRKLLEERAERFGMAMEQSRSSPDAEKTDRKVGTPEIYFGYRFARGNLGSPEGFRPEQVNSYAAPAEIAPSKAYLTGEWLNRGDYSELVSEKGSVLLRYYARNVNIVASSENGTMLDVQVDGRPIGRGIDPGDSLVREERLYRIVRSPEPGERLLNVSADSGFRIYTFTFG